MNNKIIISLIVSILVVATIIYQVSKPKEIMRDDSGNTLVVSILPVKYIITAIIGDDFEVIVLVPPGSSPETYEPTPQQLKQITKATLIFNVGLLDFEQELLGRLSEREKNKVVDLSRNVDLLAGNCCDARRSRHHHGVDPHIWMSPKRLKIMAQEAYEAISALSSESQKYRENYNLLMAQLDELDAQTTESITNSHLKYFFIYHPALTYYASDYDIEQVSIESNGKEPSAEQLKNLVKLARAEKIDMIMCQREFNRTVVETIANDIGAEVVTIDPLIEDIVQSIRQITYLITKRNE